MRILLDTHIILWALTDDTRLSSAARSLILNPDNEVYFSAASVWEVSIKRSLGRSNMPVSGEEFVSLCRDAGYKELGMSAQHAEYVEKLPSHHADPFDRMLVAQSIVEPMRFLTHDRLLESYGSTVVWV